MTSRSDLDRSYYADMALKFREAGERPRYVLELERLAAGGAPRETYCPFTGPAASKTPHS